VNIRLEGSMNKLPPMTTGQNTVDAAFRSLASSRNRTPTPFCSDTSMYYRILDLFLGSKVDLVRVGTAVNSLLAGASIYIYIS
jgi:hypothetical protein